MVNPAGTVNVRPSSLNSPASIKLAAAGGKQQEGCEETAISQTERSLHG